MKLMNRLFAVGIGLGLVAISGTAMARPRSHGEARGSIGRIFSDYDQNHDGKVGFREFASYEVRRATAEFKRKDLDKNGVLTVAERQERIRVVHQPNPHARLRLRQLQVASRPALRPRIGDPRLTEAEMRRQLDAAIEAAFRSADKNGDRSLSRWELAQLPVKSSPSGIYLVSYEI